MASLVSNAAAAMQTTMGFAEKFPIVGNIAKGLLYIKEVADTAEHNKKHCAQVSKRCDAVAAALESCAREYSAHGGPGESQLLGLKNLRDGLAQMKAVVEKHSKRGKLGRLFTANSFKEEFDEADKNMRDALQLMQLGLSETAVAQNNKLLKNATVVMEIDHKMDAAIARLTDIDTFVRELRERGGAGDAATLDRDVDERLHTLTQMIEHSESIAEHQSLVQDLMRAKIDLMKTKQDLQLRYAKKTDKGVDRALELLEQQNHKHSARRRKSAALKENEIDQSDVTVLAGEPPLGKGSFGEVFKCKYAGEICAAKHIATAGSPAENHKIFDSFKNEFALMCSINTCPRVVRVFGIITTMPGKLVMIMEYAAEGSLRDYLTKHASTPLEKSMALSLVYDIAYGMKALYAKGIHHRDLKASNVLLDGYFRAKVCDFGLSKASMLHSATASASKGGVVGTLAWESPEELDGGDDSSDSDASGQAMQRGALDDEKCDVYSFAITVWEIMTRKVPWDGKSSKAIKKRVALNEKRPNYDSGTLEPMYGKKLLAVMENGWAQRPRDRPTFADIVTDIASFERADAGPARRRSEEDIRQDERKRVEQELLAEKQRHHDELLELAEQLQQVKADKDALRQRVEAAQAAQAEAQRKAEEAAQAEAQRKAEEAAQAEARRKAAEAAQAEAQRKAEEAAQAEARRKAAEAAQAEAQRKAEEAARAEAQRKAEEAAQAQARKKTAEEGAQGEEEAVKVLEEAKQKDDIDVILAVMAQHRDSTKVQQEGCKALANVACDNAATRPTIAEKGGIEAVFHAMTQHSHHEGVQRWGCGVMYIMVDLESARPAIRKGKAVMDAARNNFPNNSDIPAWLKEIYGKIGEKCQAEARRKAAEAAQAEAQRKAEEAAQAEARRKAAEAARAEAQRKAEEAARAEAQRKAEEAAQAQARKKTAEEGAQGEEEAVKVLEEAEEKEDIDVILAVMAQHRDSTKVQEEGCSALACVAASAANRPTIAEKGGIEAVFHAMTQHSHHEDVQYWGCYMMSYMVFLESARPAIRKGKAVMDAARNNFPNNRNIQRYLKEIYGKIGEKCSIC
eukprot:Stramenopile-MAST_4_protein_3745